MTGNEMAGQELKVRKGTACVEILPGLAKSAEDIGRAMREVFGTAPVTVVAWQMHRILWGQWQDGVWKGPGEELPDARYIEELRAFHATAELRLVRAGDHFTGRVIRDDEGGNVKYADYVDSVSPFWGKRTKDDETPEGFVKLKDPERKSVLVIPVENVGQSERYGLVTRNYISVNQTTKQAGYDDYRYMAVVPMEEG